MRLGNRSSSGNCGCGGATPTCDPRRITAIVRDKDDVIVTFNDCTFMRATFDVVADNVKNCQGGTTAPADPADLSPLTKRLDDLEKFKADLCGGLTQVKRVDGVTSFVALKPDFAACGEIADDVTADDKGADVDDTPTENAGGGGVGSNPNMTTNPEPSSPQSQPKPAFKCDPSMTIWITEDGSPTTVDEAVRVLKERYPNDKISVVSNGIQRSITNPDGSGNYTIYRTGTAESLAKVGAICTNEPWSIIATIAE